MTDASWIERGLLILLMAGSLAIFWRRLSSVLKTIRGSRETADFDLAPLGPRIRQFVWEVMLQGKVIGQRPLPGLAHAFVFWGFCAFALITLNHVTSGFGLRFLSPESGFGQFYFGFVALWAVLVAVSIAGLFVRRFLVQPKWLGAVSWESGFIALLIFTLMVTYLTGLWFGEATLGGRVSWWLHTASLFIFLPLIPHTKHLHLALSPVTVFLRRTGFSRIPPLSGDEDFGLDTGKDVTRIDALQAFSCVECGRCTEHCPAYNTGKVLNPKEIVLGLRGYLKEFGSGNEAPLLGAHISEEAAFQCTTCGSCEFQCPVGIQHLPMIVGLRRGAVNTGKWEDDYGGKLFLNLERNGNALGFAASERQKFIEKAALPIYDGTQEYLPLARLHGLVRPAGARDRTRVGAGITARRHHLRRPAQGEMHRRPGAPPGE
ncbi:MAG: 4Fe-4S dicluster domain-containing protein [Ignavibacteriota bacterium]